jgi:hypothetical protein
MVDSDGQANSFNFWEVEICKFRMGKLALECSLKDSFRNDVNRLVLTSAKKHINWYLLLEQRISKTTKTLS